MKKTIEKRDFTHVINATNMLLETHVSMFEYTGLPDSVNPYYLELYLQTEGIVCFTDRFREGELVAVECTTGNDLDVYGVGREVIATTRNGQCITLRRGVDCVVGCNNRTKTPCGDIYTDAQTLADIQTSIDFLIFWTRLSPLVRVTDDKMKQKVVEAFQNIKKGIPVTLANKKLLKEYGLDDDFSIDQLTQPDFADKIQYTAKLYDDVLRWHMTRYGHATNGNSKAAQQTVDEVDSTASQSMILPLSMLWARKNMIEEVNRMFDLNASVELSGSWRAEVTAYEQQSGEDEIDGTEEDVISDSIDDDPAEDQTPDNNDNTDPEDKDESDPEDEDEKKGDDEE